MLTLISTVLYWRVIRAYLFYNIALAILQNIYVVKLTQFVMSVFFAYFKAQEPKYV